LADKAKGVIHIVTWNTLAGRNYIGALLTIVEQKSKLILIKRLYNKRADLVKEATIV
jgi:hypothetical protein